MMTWRVRLTVAAIGLSLLAGTDLSAQNPPPGGRGNGQRQVPPAGAIPNPNRPSADVQLLLDSLVMQKAQGHLQLTDDQMQRFFKPMKQLQLVRRQHLMRRTRLMNELRRMTQPEANFTDSQYEASVKQLDDLESEMLIVETKALADVDATLTPRQRARFRVFEEQMEVEKIKLLSNAARGGGPPNPAPGPGRGGGL